MNVPPVEHLRAGLVRQVRDNPRWVVALAVWLVALLALPVVGDAALLGHRAQPRVGAPPVTTGSVAPAPPPPPLTIAEQFEELAEAVESLPPSSVPLPEPATTTTEVERVARDPFDALFDLIPALPGLPALPRELEGVARAVAPIISQGCSALGLASVVIAVVAPTVQEVPLQRLLPYLGLVSSACALFPIPPVHTVCEADRPLINDVAGITSTPPVLGLGIDQIAAMEHLVQRDLGVPATELAPVLRQQLRCEIVQG